ncbi:uncharacterized protein SCODWIG_02347 [Saccharomycodes ludwigii]|uniref:Uncharacterized protein n=1 Tax=Saccharomycodes ludwigii TaxID=36035 RepID=A0A376B7A2_9ASCO|nr:uncharacterized protein SCODWIG_02347 [Saccharomycodes ludwigii]
MNYISSDVPDFLHCIVFSILCNKNFLVYNIPKARLSPEKQSRDESGNNQDEKNISSTELDRSNDYALSYILNYLENLPLRNDSLADSNGTTSPNYYIVHDFDSLPPLSTLNWKSEETNNNSNNILVDSIDNTIGNPYKIGEKTSFEDTKIDYKFIVISHLQKFTNIQMNRLAHYLQKLKRINELPESQTKYITIGIVNYENESIKFKVISTPFLHKQFWLYCLLLEEGSFKITHSHFPPPVLFKKYQNALLSSFNNNDKHIVRFNPNLRQYILDIIIHLRMHRFNVQGKGGGCSTKFVSDVILLSQCLALFLGNTYNSRNYNETFDLLVTPDIIKIACLWYLPFHLKTSLAATAFSQNDKIASIFMTRANISSSTDSSYSSSRTNNDSNNSSAGNYISNDTEEDVLLTHDLGPPLSSYDILLDPSIAYGTDLEIINDLVIKFHHLELNVLSNNYKLIRKRRPHHYHHAGGRSNNSAQETTSLVAETFFFFERLIVSDVLNNVVPPL